MPYTRQHRRPEEKRKRAFIVAVLSVAAIIVVIQLSAPQFIPSLLNAVARPFWRVGFYVEADGFRSQASLLAENESLKRRIADLELGYASSTAGMLQADNRDLLEIMSRATTSPRHFALGAVLARPPLVPYDSLVIDIGSSDGVSSTSQVYSPEKVLIGKVADVHKSSSKVILFSSPGQSYSVLIGPSRVSAVAIGRGGGQYQASVPHGSDVHVGDFVSDGDLYDRPFAVVASVLTDPADPFDTVMLAPPVNIYETRFVLVDLPSGKKPAFVR